MTSTTGVTESVVMEITREIARRFLLGQLGLRQVSGSGAEAVRHVLRDLRCIQLDPLSAIGTNADLVALARVDGLRLGEVYEALMPSHAFEHFFKERCLLPASAFPYYSGRSVETPWWRLRERHRKLPAGVVEAVFGEVRDRGPIGAKDLPDYGRVKPMDWSGWKGTAKAGTMALEVLWTRCRVVVAGRRGRQKLYDLPERSLGVLPAGGDFQRWSIRERAEAAGLMAWGHPQLWSALRKEASPEVDLVTIEGSRRKYLAPRGFLDRRFPEDDGRMRILGPLDPLIWDRKLVEHLWDFSYRWEVYTKPEKRRFGWYVCPLLFDGRLVGRLKGRIDAGELVVERVWKEEGFSDDALAACIERHQQAVGG